jgi:polar amino acid transport system substrate-binding protein
MRLGTKVEFVQVIAQSRIPLLNSGKVGVLLAALTHTREREKAIWFSITYLNDAIGMLVKKGSTVKSPGDLRGKTYSFTHGSTVAAAIKGSVPSDARVVQYQENPQAILALRQGLTDAFFSDVLTLEKLMKADPNFVIVGPELASEPIAAGIRKNDSDWRNAINAMIQDMVKDGTWDKTVQSYVQVPLSTPGVWP